MRPSDAYMRQYTNIIGPENGFVPGRRKAINWTDTAILLIPTLEQTEVKS